MLKWDNQCVVIEIEPQSGLDKSFDNSLKLIVVPAVYASLF